MAAFARLPKSEPAATSALRMSPVAIAHTEGQGGGGERIVRRAAGVR